MGQRITFPFTSEKEAIIINYGEYKTRGDREEMEDETRIFLEFGTHYKKISDVSGMSEKALNKDKEFPSFFGVFDGHSGDLCVNYIRERLPSMIKGNMNFPSHMERAFKESFKTLDEQFLREVARNEKLEDGSTATIAVIWEEKINVAHVGDCKAVVWHEGKPVVLTTDHNPSLESEKERIVTKYGGKIKNDRIRGHLAISRCFGAYPYKNKETLGEKFVSVEPEIVTFSITKNTDFLVLASDGIWDKLSVEEVMKFISDNLSDRIEKQLYYSDPGRFIYDICIEVTRMASEKKSKDNMSIIIITFDHKKKL